LIAAAPVVDTVTLGAQDVAKANNLVFDVVGEPRVATVAFDGARVSISPQTAAMVQTRQEARALTALALAYAKPNRDQAGRSKPGTVETLAALPFYLVAQNAVDNRDPSSGGIGFDSPERPTPEDYRRANATAGRKRAALAVQLAGKAGSCSAAMVALLKRMQASGKGSSRTAGSDNSAGFARMVLRDLGATIYPPDDTCL
jgi:hypothetical protein